MKNFSIFIILALGISLAVLVPTGFAMMGSGMMGGGGFGYGAGQGMMGSGNWGNRGNIMSPGFGDNQAYRMGPEYGNNRIPDYNRTYRNNYYGHYGREKALTKSDAESIARNYIGRNPNLKQGRIQDKETYFETEIRTRDNSLVTKLTIDKNTGYVHELY